MASHFRPIFPQNQFPLLFFPQENLKPKSCETLKGFFVGWKIKDFLFFKKSSFLSNFWDEEWMKLHQVIWPTVFSPTPSICRKPVCRHRQLIDRVDRPAGLVVITPILRHFAESHFFSCHFCLCDLAESHFVAQHLAGFEPMIPGVLCAHYHCASTSDQLPVKVAKHSINITVLKQPPKTIKLKSFNRRYKKMIKLEVVFFFSSWFPKVS